MPTVRVCVDITEDHFRAYQDEATRRGVTVEDLVQQMVQGLVEELDRDAEAARGDLRARAEELATSNKCRTSGDHRLDRPR